MSTRRESWYWCTFRSPGYFRSGLVHAWDARSAAAEFEEEVRADTDEVGAISVEPGWGHLRDEELSRQAGDASGQAGTH